MKDLLGTLKEERICKKNEVGEDYVNQMGRALVGHCPLRCSKFKSDIMDHDE